MEVPADKVIWPLMYKDIGNDMETLYTNIQSKNRTIIEFLESNGISRDEISVSPPEIIDMEAERYINQAIQYRYNATSFLQFHGKQASWNRRPVVLIRVHRSRRRLNKWLIYLHLC